MATVLDSFRLDGRVAVVTGASRGLGAAMAQALAEAGADVALVARGDLEPTAAAVLKAGGQVLTIHADLAKPEAPATVLRNVQQHFGRADILINNAGIIRRAPLLEFTAQDWHDVINVNLHAPFLLAQQFARGLIERKSPGKIINIASLLSFQGGIRVPAYTAAKSALTGLTRALANELAPQGINVNALAPGYMATDNTAALRADAARNADILGRIPAGRWGTPDDLKGVTVFLASTASDYMHGFTLAVDGGWLAR